MRSPPSDRTERLCWPTWRWNYSRQANRKTRARPQHADRDAQFRYINDQVPRFQKRKNPAISVDMKKKELIGDFKNPGRDSPPGTSKWNKIEHRLFSHIAMNWRGKPLTSLSTIVSLIGSTKTDHELRVRSEIDHHSYGKGVVVTAERMAKIRLEPHAFHGEWNYKIRSTKGRSH